MSEASAGFPAKLYLFGDDGKYDKRDVVIITDAEHLNSAEIRSKVSAHIKSGREVRITDPDDFCIFHAAGGKILHPAPETDRDGWPTHLEA